MKGDGQIDVVIADDHPVVIEGLAVVLDGGSDEFRIVGRSGDADSALAAIREQRPAVALVKAEMKGSLELLRRVRRARVACRVVLFGATIREELAVEAVRLGARGLLLKTLPVELIRECVRKVARGERWIEQDAAERALERLAGDGTRTTDGLTRREIQIARLAAGGLRNQEIAQRLGISVGTVKIHLHSVYRKLGIRGRVQLAARARSGGLD